MSDVELSPKVAFGLSNIVMAALIGVASFLGGAFYNAKNPFLGQPVAEFDSSKLERRMDELKSNLSDLKYRVNDFRQCECSDRRRPIGSPVGSPAGAAPGK